MFGRTTSTKVGNGTSWRTLSSLSYNSAGLMSKQTYGNGDYIDFTYDSLDRITEKRYNGSSTRRATYAYGADGSLARTTDFSTGTTTRYVYDLADRLVSVREYDGTSVTSNALRASTEYIYADKTNYLTGMRHFSPLGTQTVDYTYGDITEGQMPDQVYSVKWNGEEKLSYTYDPLGRITNRQIITADGVDMDNIYTYVNAGTDQTTTLVQSVENDAGDYTYTYDNVGNITSVHSLYEDSPDYYFNFTNSFEYDALNQLVRENDQRTGKTYTYSYTNGNITERKEYAYTTGELGPVLDTKTWTYGDGTWGDLLTNFDGQAITYDTIGNPVAIGSKTLTWTGRQLEQITEGDSVISYTYDMDGRRTSKTVDGVTTEYFYNGDILAGQKTGNKVMLFLYDEAGDYFGFTYEGHEYYYVKNAQNDVIGIATNGGWVVAHYFYDAWGNVTIKSDTGYTIYDIPGHPAADNPIRYRSYYYDTETQWYFLTSRYYFPAMQRFLNADSVISNTGESVHGYNLFAYCFNSPVNMQDDTGYWPKWATNLAKVAVGAIAIAIGVAATVATGGAAAPVLLASVKIAVTSAAIGAVVGAGVSAVSHRISTGSWKGSGKAALSGAVDGAADGFMWGGISAGATFTTVAAKGVQIQQIGNLKPTNKSGKGFQGVQYKNQRGSIKSFELHSPHKSGPHQKWHWQQNTWNPNTGGITGRSKYWTIFGRRF